MPTLRVFADKPHPDWTPGTCMCFWREDLPCPNAATWRVDNIVNESVSEMCTPHKEAFARLRPQAQVRLLLWRWRPL